MFRSCKDRPSTPFNFPRRRIVHHRGEAGYSSDEDLTASESCAVRNGYKVFLANSDLTRQNQPNQGNGATDDSGKKVSFTSTTVAGNDAGGNGGGGNAGNKPAEGDNAKP